MDHLSGFHSFVKSFHNSDRFINFANNFGEFFDRAYFSTFEGQTYEKLYYTPQIPLMDESIPLAPHKTDADLFRHNWGDHTFQSDDPFGEEGWLAMAAHASNMNGLDRMTFESCTPAGPFVIGYGLNVPAVPYWKSVERLMTDTGCTAYQAETLLAQWASIEATRSMVDEFVKWIIDRGVEPAIQYFAMLVDELPEIPRTLTEHRVGIENTSTRMDWDECGELEYHHMLEESEPPASPVQGRKLYKTIDDGLNSLPPYMKGTEEIHNELLPWLTATEFDRLYGAIESTTLVSELKEIGSWLFHNKVMQYKEGNDFWAVYRAKKKALHYTGRKNVARETYREILAFDKLSSLKRFGFNMHKALKGSVPELANLGYKIKSHLWDAYNKRKAELAKQPEIYDSPADLQPEPPIGF